MICCSSCPGLDLHFWRKICKNCKCTRDNHDVEEDDYPQFQLLFGASKKTKQESMLLCISSKKENHELQFDWIPPDTSNELATDYMKALPEDKLPIRGSNGAALRRQQLQKQLPLHDVDCGACDHLSESEQDQFKKYLENLKSYVGQGKVCKMFGAQPFKNTFLTPANATDMQAHRLEYKIPVPGVHLHTPSSFLSKVSPSPIQKYKKQLLKDIGDLSNLINYEFLTEIPENGTSIVRSQEILTNACSPSEPLKSKEKIDLNLSNLEPTDYCKLDSTELKPTTISLRNPEIVNATESKKNVVFPQFAKSQDSIRNKEINNFNIELKYDPTGNLQDRNHSYQAELDNLKAPCTHLINSENQSCSVFPQKITKQPAYVLDHPVKEIPEMLKDLKIHSEKLQECNKCKEIVHIGDVVVKAEKAENKVWHPGCFVCSTCNELLVDLIYFYYKNHLYCGRDLAKFLKIPRCFACDELIFVREYTVAEGQSYHVKHFCCWDCDVPLAGQQYTLENDRPLCLPCYQKSYAKTCEACKKIIAADQQGVVVKDLNFHANDRCFCCHACKKSLFNGKMAVKDFKLFCSKECISKFFSK
ncbi:testin isoform X2 [Prorops nasuta]